MSNSKFRKALVKLMEEKARMLLSLGIYVPYFTDSDKGTIYSWNEEKARYILSRIIRAVEEGGSGLSSDTCPFCIYYDNIPNNVSTCESCKYGENHGVCPMLDSDYNTIHNMLPTYSSNIFTNDWYKRILRSIMEELNISIDDLIDFRDDEVQCR